MSGAGTKTRQTYECDLVVVGSGAGGLAAAITAARLGLDVILVEKESQIGGTTAWSGGWLWVPRNPLAIKAGIVEELEAPLNYLRAELGDGFDEPMARMYLEQCPKMVAFFQDHTEVAFVDGNAIPDFHAHSAGAGLGGRSVCAAPFDGRRLGARIKDLKPPLDLMAPFGMGIASGVDLRHFLNVTRKPAAFLHVTKRLFRHVWDRLIHGRGMHLVNGNALVARLLKSADLLGVRILTSTPAKGLILDHERVIGLHAGQDDEPIDIMAARGAVLASGGFPHDSKRQADHFPQASNGATHYSAAPSSNTGDGLRLGEAAGGRVCHDLTNAGAWTPVSLVPRADGTTGHFPHLIERAKPGLIAVLANGQRFSNEANSYHDMMSDLFKNTPTGKRPEAWLVCDHAFQRRYGLGASRPWPFLLRTMLANGYLKRAQTPQELAQVCGIDPEGLTATFAAYNSDAAKGEDPLFGRGATPYNRIQGEPDHGPNPCVAPIVKAPFYAVRIVAGSLGTFAGLETDIQARVMGQNGKPLAGLYAVGNDMSSLMRGRYPAGGITLGPAMTFGYIAAHHASGVPLDNNHSSQSDPTHHPKGLSS
jgi:succinate dehydrogenase/fumarate reductase flavoprotein subunit